MNNFSNKSTFYLFLFCTIAVYALGLRLDIMGTDATSFAEMSLEMLRKKNFLQPTCLGLPYLDKPPLLFWLDAASFYLLGVGTFSYKLPSFLFALLGIYSTYRLARMYYSAATAYTAAIILATTQALFLIANDVRTDTLLMGSVIFSIWQWAHFFETSKTKSLAGASIGTALALLSKGPVGVIAIGAAIIPQLWWNKKMNRLLDWRLINAPIIIVIMLLPMCIGLFEQYGSTGLKFYFWTQSFGRITGENKWNNHPDTFFLVHSTAWAFMPWSLFLFVGVIKNLFTLVKTKFAAGGQPEIISLSGFILVLVALSFSKYQLPHYIFVVYPLAAIIAAKCFYEIDSNAKLKKVFGGIQIAILCAILVLACLLQYCFGGNDIFSMCLIVLLIILVAVIFFFSRNLLYTSLATALSFNLMLSGFYYPSILKYQPEADFGRYIHQHLEGDFILYQYVGNFGLAFYAQQTASFTTLFDLAEVNKKIIAAKSPLYIITLADGMGKLREENVAFQVIAGRSAFNITNLNWKFINPKTREEVCEKVYLLKINPAQ